MKKIFFLFLIPILSFSSFLDKEFKANIKEINGDKVKEYILDYKKDNIKVTITSPEINKGEIYTYKNNKKYIYYPKINQEFEQNFANEDNDMIKFLSEIKKINKTTIIEGKKYIVENGKVIKVTTANYNIDIDYNLEKMPKEIRFTNNNTRLIYKWTY